MSCFSFPGEDAPATNLRSWHHFRGENRKANPMIQLVYSEKDVEDLLEQHCEHFLGLKFIARQHRTAVGIIDIVARQPELKETYYIIELKRGQLDTSAYAQAMRYSEWMNAEHSKAGQRCFIPFLIGETLHQDLDYLVEWYDCDLHKGIANLRRPVYRLFGFDPMEGVHFTSVSVSQDEANTKFGWRHCHITQMEESLIDHECRLMRERSK